jgi:hypothetical protein
LSDLTFQKQLLQFLENEPWSICYFGHPLTHQLKDQPAGLIRSNLAFKWVHCYAVHQRVIADLVAYLEAVMERPAGHPDGGRMYIDGAFNLFVLF